MLFTSPDEFVRGPRHAVTVFGMSGVGKTRLAALLRQSQWFHYSVDYRIGTRHMGEYIVDNFKTEAMKVPFLRDLLRSDSIKITSNIKFSNLEPLSTYLGLPGDPARGGLPFAEYQRRQAQHREAEILALLEIPRFIERAHDLYGYDNFVADTGGSLIEVIDHLRPRRPRGQDARGEHRPALHPRHRQGRDRTRAALQAAPQADVLPAAFLLEQWAEYKRLTGATATTTSTPPASAPGVSRRCCATACPATRRWRTNTATPSRRPISTLATVRDGGAIEFLDLWPRRSGSECAPSAARRPCRIPDFNRQPRDPIMPIRIPDDLPARKTLEAEGVAVMDSTRAARQDIRPLQIGLLNLMPNKERTETQFTRLIGATPLQVDLTLVRVTDHQSKNTSEDYLKTFYSTWSEVRGRKFDGFIITGAPIANIPFEEVKYWPEMLEIMDWTQTNVHHTMFICWGAQAALHHFHGVERYRMPHKGLRGLPAQGGEPALAILRGFSDDLAIPVSRYNDIDRKTIGKRPRSPDRQRRDRRLHAGRPQRGRSTCSTTSSTTTARWPTSTSATARPGSTPPPPDQRLPGRRSDQGTGEPLAQPRPPAVPELDQRDLPDDPVRHREDRH
jgi:hypothetical protein